MLAEQSPLRFEAEGDHGVRDPAARPDQTLGPHGGEAKELVEGRARGRLTRQIEVALRLIIDQRRCVDGAADVLERVALGLDVVQDLARGSTPTSHPSCWMSRAAVSSSPPEKSLPERP